MNITDTLISSAITAGLYILYKLIQRFYIQKSECHNNTLEIVISDKEKPEIKNIVVDKDAI
jgi:hypothetical protein